MRHTFRLLAASSGHAAASSCQAAAKQPHQEPPISPAGTTSRSALTRGPSAGDGRNAVLHSTLATGGGCSELLNECVGA
jgi:hypothetical protein